MPTRRLERTVDCSGHAALDPQACVQGAAFSASSAADSCDSTTAVALAEARRTVSNSTRAGKEVTL